LSGNIREPDCHVLTSYIIVINVTH